MTFTTESIPPLHNTVALITGGNGGLGYHSALALSAKGAHVILGSRDPDKGAQARDTITSQHPDASIEVLPLDLASLASIATAAHTVTSTHSALNILMNNAGIMALPESTTEDGFESQFGVNHLGHWALTAQLMPLLTQTPGARVVTTTSTAHHFASGINHTNPHLRGKYSPWGAYGHSKLANYYFALGLHKKAQAAGLSIMSMLAHPGLAHTDLQVRTAAEGGAGASGEFFKRLAATRGMTAADGALPQLRAAVDPDAQSGQFYAPRKVNTGDPIIRPFLRPFAQSQIAKLWALSARETGLAIL